MSEFVQRFLNEESGATAIEYGLIAALVAVTLVAALTALGAKVSGLFSNVANAMP
jgi:pilus assembly protein Flp/PilA